MIGNQVFSASVRFRASRIAAQMTGIGRYLPSCPVLRRTAKTGWGTDVQFSSC